MRQAIFLAALLAAVPLEAAESQDHPCAALAGNWQLDLQSMPIPPEARPRSVTVHFSLGADGRWETRYLIVAR